MDQEKPSFASVLKNPGFKYLWINQILVQLAYNTLNFTLIIWVFKLTGSSLAVASLLISMYLPAILWGIFAGVFVDIADKRKIIILIDILLGLAFLGFIFIKYSYPLILLNIFFINSLGQFFIPAEGSSIPMLVPKRQLILANSLFSLTLYGSFMIGFSLAGPMLNFFGINSIFYLVSISMVVAFLAALNLPSIKNSAIHQKYRNFFGLDNFNNIWKLTRVEAQSTVRFIRGKLSISAAIILMSIVQGIIGILAVGMPSYMETVLHIHATDTSYFVMVPLGLGMVVGALIIGRFAHNKPRRSLVIPAITLAGALFLVAGLIPLIAQYFSLSELPIKVLHPRYFFRAPSVSTLFAIGAFILGLAAVTIIIPSQTVLQEGTTEKNRGKIFSFLGVIMYSASAVPVILAGVVADLFGPSSLFLILGGLVFILGLVSYRPAVFFKEAHLPYKFREFLGLGHWENSKY